MRKSGLFRSFILILAVLLAFGGCGSQPVESPLPENVDNDPVAVAQLINLVNFEGEVTVQDADGKITAAYEGMRLVPGDSIITGKDSLANLDLDQGRLVMLSEETELALSQVEADNVTLYLKSGTVLNDVEKGSGSYTVQTDNMTMGVLGTVFTVKVDSASGIASTILLQGSLQLTFGQVQQNEDNADPRFVMHPGQCFVGNRANLDLAQKNGTINVDVINFEAMHVSNQEWLRNAMQNRQSNLNPQEAGLLVELNTLHDRREKMNGELEDLEENLNQDIQDSLLLPENPSGPDYSDPPTIGSVDTSKSTVSPDSEGESYSFPGMAGANYAVTENTDNITMTATGTNIRFITQKRGTDFLNYIFYPFGWIGINDGTASISLPAADWRDYAGVIRAYDSHRSNYSSMIMINGTPTIEAALDPNGEYVKFSLTNPPILANSMIYKFLSRETEMEYSYTMTSDDLSCEGYYSFSASKDNLEKCATATSLSISSTSPTLYVRLPVDVSFSDIDFTWKPTQKIITNRWNHYGTVRVYQTVYTSIPDIG